MLEVYCNLAETDVSGVFGSAAVESLATAETGLKTCEVTR